MSLAGLLEIADREFQAIQDSDAGIREGARASALKGEFEDVEITADALRAYLDKKMGSDYRMSDYSYEWTARLLRTFGFTNFRQVDECISTFDDDRVSRVIDGTRQGKFDALNMYYSPEWVRGFYPSILGKNTIGMSKQLGRDSHCHAIAVYNRVVTRHSQQFLRRIAIAPRLPPDLRYNPLACAKPPFSTIPSLAAAASTAWPTSRRSVPSCRRLESRLTLRQRGPHRMPQRKSAWLFARDLTPSSLAEGMAQSTTYCRG